MGRVTRLLEGRPFPINETMSQCPMKFPKGNNNESMFNDRGERLKPYGKVEHVDRIANDLIRKYTRFGYDAEKWRKAIYKAVWHSSSEAKVWEVYEASFNPWVKDSLRYFLGACKKQRA